MSFFRPPCLPLLAVLCGCAAPPSVQSGLPPPAPSSATSAASSSTSSIATVASPEPTLTAPPEVEGPPPLRARFLSVGDVIFGRRVQKTIEAKGDPEFPFRPMADLYASMDFTFANLENPFFSGKKPNVTPPGKKYAVLWARPEHVKTLVKYKIKAVNLANNHAMDQDLAGLKETLKTLDGEGIAHVGTGRNLEEAWTPMFVDVGGLKIGFVGASFTSKNDMGYSRNPYVARIEDENRLLAACKKAREGAHFVVVTFHAGDEHKFTPNAGQKAFVKAALRAGADIVIGGHPHVVQPAEKIDGKWVFYSIGNYVFDQTAPDNSEGVAVELRLSLPREAAAPSGSGAAPLPPHATLEAIKVHPVIITDTAPTPADDAHAAKILQRLGVSGRDLEP